MEGCIVKGLEAMRFPMEVGGRGFVATSMVKLVKELGLDGKERPPLI